MVLTSALNLGTLTLIITESDDYNLTKRCKKKGDIDIFDFNETRKSIKNRLIFLIEKKKKLANELEENSLQYKLIIEEVKKLLDKLDDPDTSDPITTGEIGKSVNDMLTMVKYEYGNESITSGNVVKKFRILPSYKNKQH